MRHAISTISAAVALALLACGDPAETPRAELPVVVDASGLATVETDLGYQVTLSEAQLMVEDLSFTIAGEAHAALSPIERVAELLVPTAHAHPGHFQGGDVTGELPGRFLLRWSAEVEPAQRGAALYGARCAGCHGQDMKGGDGPGVGGHPAIAEAVENGVGEMPPVDLRSDEVADIQAFVATQLGVATLLVGQYTSANFGFSRATADDGLPDDDPLSGHTMRLRGVAARGSTEVAFEALIKAPADRELIGAPFDYEVVEGADAVLGLKLDVVDPLQGDTLFDGIEFSELAEDATGTAVLEAPDGENAPAANLLRRRLLTHDHYEIRASSATQD